MRSKEFYAILAFIFAASTIYFANLVSQYETLYIKLEFTNTQLLEQCIDLLSNM